MKQTLIAACIALAASQAAQAGKLGFSNAFADGRAELTPEKAALLHDTSVTADIQKLYTTRQWTYSGNTGPKNWANLHRDYRDCAGSNQSPINLTGFTESVLKPIDFNYQPRAAALLNDGRTVRLNYRQPEFIKVEGSAFHLQQFQFHAPSENQINGRSFPLEAHFVHQNDRGDLAVVSVMFELGPENPALPKHTEELPSQEGEMMRLESPISPDQLLPANRDYFRFNGSLTTPPCTEGVRWFVLKTPATASEEQLAAMKAAIGQDNNRPVQPLNARVVLK
ncbi:MAG: carbonic anhydrase [Granulosicoccaceae bacterium]